MSDSKLHQRSDLNEVINKRNQWLFCSNQVSRYLVKSDDSILIPSGNMWYSPLKVYPSYIYNLLKLAYFLVKQLFSDKASFQTKSAHILFSTGEGHDLKNYNKFFRDSNVEVIQIEAFNTSQKINFNIVELKSLFSLFLENLQEASSILKLKLPPDLRKKIISHSLPQLATYVYLCAFFSAIKEQIPNVKIFHSGAVLLSMAATRVGIETVWFYHGLVQKQSKTYFPFGGHIYVYANEEKSYFENIAPNSNVCMYPVKELSKLEKRVIIFLRLDDDDISEETLSEILTFFLKKDYQIFLKKHPNYTGSLADKIASKYNLEMVDREKDASEIISYLRPSFTVGWTSTALCESLRHGVVPVSISDEMNCLDQDNHTWAVYPIKRRTLSWGEEKERIFELLEDTSLYAKILSELRVR